MRILDNGTDTALTDILIMLTKQEARDMCNALDQLLREEVFDHTHVLDFDGFQCEVTLATYDEKVISNNPYTQRVLKLIREGK